MIRNMPHATYCATGVPKRGCSEGGVAPVRAPCLAGDALLREEARGGDHRKAAVAELLLLHETEPATGERGPRQARVEEWVAP